MNSLNPKRLEQTISAIEALDLGPIKFKATCQEDGYGWTPDHADRMELAYKRYLVLHAKYPGLTLAPNQEVDRFWHLHILDTRKYAADCEALFGYFLHHYPYLGLRGEDDAKLLQSTFATTQALYAKEFGDEAVTMRAAFCGADPGQKTGAAFCGASSGRNTSAAFCGAGQKASAAFCGADPGQKTSAAFCGTGASRETSAAFCGSGQKTNAAFCGAGSVPAVQAAEQRLAS